MSCHLTVVNFGLRCSKNRPYCPNHIVPYSDVFANILVDVCHIHSNSCSGMPKYIQKLLNCSSVKSTHNICRCFWFLKISNTMLNHMNSFENLQSTALQGVIFQLVFHVSIDLIGGHALERVVGRSCLLLN